MRKNPALAIVTIAGLIALGLYLWRESSMAPPTVPASPLATKSGATGPSPVQRPAPRGVPSIASIKGAPHRTDARQELPPGPVRDVLPVLLARASAPNPSPVAARTAFEVLNACRLQAIASQDNPHRTRATTEPNCAGITSKDWADAVRLLKLAADMGDEFAGYEYASGAPLAFKSREELIEHPEDVIEFRQNAVRYLVNASENGNLDAIFALSQAFNSGSLGQKDRALAYEYAFAWVTLGGIAGTPSDAYLSQLQSQLTPEELSRAQQSAQALVDRYKH